MSEQKHKSSSKWMDRLQSEAERAEKELLKPSDSLKKEKLETRLIAAEKRRQAALHDKQFKAGLTSLRIIGMSQNGRPAGKFCLTAGCWQERPCNLHPTEAPPPSKPRAGFAYSLNVYDEIQEILPRMYLGNYYAASRRDIMKQYDISHVLTIGNGINPPDMGLVRKQLSIEDESRENLLHHMLDAFAFIDEGRGIDPKTPFCPCLPSSSPSSSLSTKTQEEKDEEDCAFFFEESSEPEVENNTTNASCSATVSTKTSITTSSTSIVKASSSTPSTTCSTPSTSCSTSSSSSVNNNMNSLSLYNDTQTSSLIFAAEALLKDVPATANSNSEAAPFTNSKSSVASTSTIGSECVETNSDNFTLSHSLSSSTSSISSSAATLTTNNAAAPSSSAVFVHCAAGVSRSASICIAYCMVREGMSYEQAHAHVLKCRPVIRPNYGFTSQLKLLHAKAGDVRAAALEWLPGKGEYIL